MRIAICSVLLIVTLASSAAEVDPLMSPERVQALDLYAQGKFVQALPLLEKLSTASPSDVVLKEAWAFSMLASSAAIQDPVQRQDARARARRIAVEAETLGGDSNLLKVVLSVPEDGGVEAKPANAADVAMEKAESDFVRGDLDAALAGYRRVLEIDPRHYEAMLFAGDAYFKKGQVGEAMNWYERAAAVEPDRETAWRYWGDALMASAEVAEARRKFIEAVVAEPYSRKAWIGLAQWADANRMELRIVQLDEPVSVGSKDGEIDIHLAPDSLQGREDEMGAWLIYAGTRAEWRDERFAATFPQEGAYRRSLQEEVQALQAMLVFIETGEDGAATRPVPPAFRGLVAIADAGFLEPWILLQRADEEIAQDYAGYRSANRARITRYLDEFVVPKAGGR